MIILLLAIQSKPLPPQTLLTTGSPTNVAKKVHNKFLVGVLHRLATNNSKKKLKKKIANCTSHVANFHGTIIMTDATKHCFLQSIGSAAAPLATGTSRANVPRRVQDFAIGLRVWAFRKARHVQSESRRLCIASARQVQGLLRQGQHRHGQFRQELGLWAGEWIYSVVERFRKWK